jgi:type II secretory pathway pseudopilin PulG
MNGPMVKARALNSESGFAIIEVVVSAAVLAIVAMAVLAGVDGAQGSSAREKARAIAANIAEQDQERLRAMSVTTLTNVPQSAPVTIDNVTYTIKSEAQWVTDDTGGTPACGSSTNRSEYFHITSTVSSNLVGVRIPAVKIDSLVSPTVAYAQSHGTFGAKVVDRNNNGIPNVAVTGGGASSLGTKNTDQNGCVIWRSIPIGTYTATINQTGYGDENGTQNAQRSAIVSPNTVTFVQFSYDVVGSGTVSINTHVPGQAFSATDTTIQKPSRARAVSDNMADRTWTPAPAPASTISVDRAFPFKSKSYGFFAGSCVYESPVNVGQTNYFTTTNSAAAVLVDPGTTFTGTTVKVFQPPVQIRVSKDYNNQTPPAGRMEIRLALQTPSAFAGDTCTEPEFVMPTMAWPTSTWTPVPTGGAAPSTLGYASWSATTFDPGLPFGTYKITCVRDTSNNRVLTPNLTYDNTSPNGGPLLDIATTGTGAGKWSSTGSSC